MTQMSFRDLGVAKALCRTLDAMGHKMPTPIQGEAIPQLLSGRDVLAIAQTGSGKTAAFTLPMLQHLSANRERPPARSTRALILAPTRELAIQIAEAVKSYGGNLSLRHAVVVGGVSQNKQVRAVANGVDILIATPGRLLDLVEQRHIRLDATSWLVLDEADRMLDMGFIRDVRKIVARIPDERQSLLFSATMPTDVERLAAEILREPSRIQITPRPATRPRIDQRVFHVDAAEKRELLVSLLEDADMQRVLIFTRTKRGADRLNQHLGRANITAEAIHGNKSQSARQQALRMFKTGRARVLVATDIAARGIDIDGVTHVVNFELPNEPESYVHRIGRTARAGATGIALSFCDPSERQHLRAIERLTETPLVVAGGDAANIGPTGERGGRKGSCKTTPARSPAPRRRRQPRVQRASA